MPRPLTPGVYFERPAPPPAPPNQRTDVTAFVGMAERGPLHTPRRLTGWRQFQELFGGFLPYSNLAYAVRGFFDNGGQVSWVVRVADDAAARAARVAIPGEAPLSLAWTVEAINPGTWGNRLSLVIQKGGLGATSHVPAQVESHWLLVQSIVGFSPGSRVRLTQLQAGGPHTEVRTVEEVDAALGALRFGEKVEGAFQTIDQKKPPVHLESLEVTLLVLEDGKPLERFADLAPDPRHPRHAPAVVNDPDAGSRRIRLRGAAGDLLPQVPAAEALRGGLDGLATLGIYDHVGPPDGSPLGLAALEAIDEVSLLALPDLSARPRAVPRPGLPPRRRVERCSLSTPATRRDVTGIVVDADTGLRLPGVQVDAHDGLAPQRTATDGTGLFTLSQILPGPLELLLELEGYLPVSLRLEVPDGVGAADLGQIALTPQELPPRLPIVDVELGQAAMIAQCEKLRDRFALLEPPLGAATGLPPSFEEAQAWRARFDTAFAALYWPWLVVRDPLAPTDPVGRPVPPTGHVAGVYAATDLAGGVFRPPANRELAGVEDLTETVDDARHGVLNPLGINALRALPGRGVRVLGARTLSRDGNLRFVNVRRLLNALTETFLDGLQWAVFEPNGPDLRFGLRLWLVNHLDALWRQGAFAGDTPEAAFQVRCDATTTPPEQEADGRLLAEVAIAPVVPYEFIVLRLGTTADALRVSEA